jgi:2,3-bisphosphoglycerate-independent phosphoglycerate mutase
MEIKKKVLLIILDGVGCAPLSKGNAVVLAKPDHLASMWSAYPHTYLLASGQAVGLPEGTKGNSEVGHMNIGAGRVVVQTLPRINQSIDNGHYFKNNTLLEALSHSKNHNSNIHLLSLVSDGGVHSHIKHLLATLKFFSQNSFQGNLFLHAFTDGRDASPNAGINALTTVQEYMNMYGVGQIATVCGRAWAMDRNNQWDRTKKAYDLLTTNMGEICGTYSQCLTNSYANGVTDEFVNPTVLIKGSNIKPNDVVLFLNFRPDRALQLSQALIEEEFDKFPRQNIQPIFFASMVEYRKNFPQKVVFPKQYINLPLGNILSTQGLRQLRIAESEKFPHVTYFFNGGTNVKYSGEDRIEVPSPSVATYDLQPEMSAEEMTNVLLCRIKENIYDFILVNFANPDMVAHSGNIDATIKAVSTVDVCANKLIKEFVARGGVAVVTADHGNAEELINLDTNEMDTEHSYNPVPLIIVGLGTQVLKLRYGALRDISPTILDIMNIPKPMEMNGKSLLPFSSF